MHENDGRVVSNFVVQALQGNPLTVYGEGNQTRSFCYVSDLVEGMIRAMDCEDFTGPVNLGNPNEVTIREIAETVQRLAGTNNEIAFEPLPQDDPARRKPDIALAKERLGWEPAVDLEDGLTKTIEYFREILNAG
jgi:UDP-glucuronate decarboxylase